MTEYKINELKISFPDISTDLLLEILLSCNGSVKQSKHLLYESIPNKKRKLNSDNINNTIYQSTLKDIFHFKIYII